MVNIAVDFNKTIGKIKPMHAIGQPPFKGGFLSVDFSPIQHLTNARIPYSRLHDVGGAFGGNRFVDIPNLFRDFDADETDPANYDFAFTDVLIENMYQYDVKPIFRLGVTIENQAHIKAYRIYPPKDYSKWARICEHVIRHYNEGWADGYHYGIEYWEIWNEPDNGEPGRNQMWIGTPEQYYELYDVAAKHLKACFGDSIKIGGYGCCTLYGLFYEPEVYGVSVEKREKDEKYVTGMHRVSFFHGFLEYLQKHGSPIDFFSWHSYDNVEKTAAIGEYIHRKFSEYGHSGIELHLNEWNVAHTNALHGTSFASASSAAMMCKMQESATYMLCYYDTRITASAYGGFFAPLTYEPVSTYYAFAAFGKLYELENQVSCELEGDADGFYALAAAKDEKKAVYLVNFSEQRRKVNLNIDDRFHVYLVDGTHKLEKIEVAASDFEMDANQVVLIEN